MGTTVLENSLVLREDSLSDGGTLVLAVGASPMLLELQIYDDTQWHGKHKFALRSPKLQFAVERIDVTVGEFKDQGWGGCQARLFIYLHDPANDDNEVARLKIFGPLRTP